MDKQQSLLLKKYLDLVYRWKYFLVFLLLLSLPVGLTLYLKVPKEYAAQSLLSYQQQKISPNKLSPDVTARIKDIVSTLTQIVTSRTNLEDFIRSFDLYLDSRLSLPMEDVIDTMRDNISIEPSPRGDTFVITYVGSSPNKVVKVTNALASKFIEENLKYREERASETSSYTSNELAMAKTMMDLKEAAMRDYKMKHYNEMPEQRDGNVSRLISLQEQYQSKQANILEMERTQVMIQEQIAIRKKVVASQSAIGANAVRQATTRNKGDQPETPYEQLRRLQSKADLLLLRYTENHPDVKLTRKKIARLEQDLGGRQEPTSSDSVPRLRQPVDADLLQFKTQLNDVSLTIKSIKAEKSKLSERITLYDDWLTKTPIREAEWSALTREYAELKRHYDFLVAQDLQAKSMLNLERRQKGSQFKIEDPARLPETPIRPNFIKILGATVVLAMGLGGALLLLINFIDGSFRDPEELEAILGVPVVTTITHIETGGEKKKRFRKAWAIRFLVLLGTVLVCVYFWYAWHTGKILI